MLYITDMKKWLTVITILAALFAFWLLYIRDVSAGNYHRYSPSPSPSSNPCDLIDVAELVQDNVPTPCFSPSPSASSSASPSPFIIIVTPPSHDDGGDGLGCAVHDCSGNKIGEPTTTSYPNSPYSPYDGQPVGWK